MLKKFLFRLLFSDILNTTKLIISFQLNENYVKGEKVFT